MASKKYFNSLSVNSN